MLFWYAHHVHSGLKGEVFHRSQVAMAAQMRNSQFGIFIPGNQKLTAAIIKECFKCIKQGQGTIYADMKSYHRIKMEPPFTRLSLDVIGPFTVRASHNSRALLKIYSLIEICLSTGLLCQILLDNVKFSGIVRALWLLQMRHCNQVTHLHTDHGSYFSKLGDVAALDTGKPEKPEKGEY